jgi:phosphoglycolate/pyridoxal phosphate phosphatase family enzyme
MESRDDSLAARINDIRLFLLDLDGTVYLEDQLIPGALEFIENVRRRGMQYIFLTNNSSRSATAYCEKLRKLGFPVTMDNVFTSGQATALYLLKEKATPPRIYLVGTRELHMELQGYGLTVVADPAAPVDYVVIGFDRELAYAKLEDACALLDKGVPFIATNPDLVCPIRDQRYIPDCGSMCQMIFNATGRNPQYIGKPEATMVQMLSEKTGIACEHIAMIGDRLYTDIALGRNAGITTICVLSGESNREQIAQSPHKPDFVIDSIAVLNSYL